MAFFLIGSVINLNCLAGPIKKKVPKIVIILPQVYKKANLFACPNNNPPREPIDKNWKIEPNKKSSNNGDSNTNILNLKKYHKKKK